MSLQTQVTQPFQQQQQPMQVYPTTVTYESPPPHHSNGSFGSVFVVLAIIIVVSAVACCLGRFCSRKSHSHSNNKHVKQQKHQPKHQQNKNHNLRAKEVDIEFGFDKKIAASKPINGHGIGSGPPIGRGPPRPLAHGHGGDMKGFVHPHHGHVDMKSFELKLGNEGKTKGRAMPMNMME